MTVSVGEIAFLRPEVLSAVPLVGVALLLWRLFRRRRFLAGTEIWRFRHLRHRPSVVRRAPAVLAILALALTVLALMEPVLLYSESRIEAQGLDVVLVVDLSASMLEAMGTSSGPRREAQTREGMRLEVTKQALRHFVRQRRDDRIGLVVFSERAYLISPLTFDHEYLLEYVSQVDDTLPRAEGKTAIGEGIHLANVLLSRQSRSDADNKVIVVFTDGEHNAGRDPLDALADAKAAGARTHLIGVNLEEVIRKKAAVAELVGAVRRHGGRYFEANSARQLQEANTILAAVEKGRLSGKRIEVNAPIFSWFSIPALLLLSAALGLRVIPFFADFT